MVTNGDKNCSFAHTPVMLREVLEGLRPVSEGVYVDCTLGGGGHSAGILEKSAPGGRVIGLDQDEDAIAAAARLLAAYGDRVTLVKENFSRLDAALDNLGVEMVNGVLFDLGVSSYQLDNPARGFSYMHDAPLDMRMDRDAPVSAREIVNNLPDKELIRIIREYGEEKFAARIAALITLERKKLPIENTARLADIIKMAIPARARREGPHPAKRTFQAIRIAVNNELGIIRDALITAVKRLIPGGRLCVITFHSLEDRIVKDTFRGLARPCICPRDFPVCNCGRVPEIKDIAHRGLTPGPDELEQNPRARSARLRIIEKMPVTIH
jgi:16S rRNA (cytosine1402-N4)-methyltransferase